MATSNTKSAKPTGEVDTSTPPAPAEEAVSQQHEAAVEVEQRTVEEPKRVSGGPSFGLCAGTVADLAQVEKTVDPFTGNVVTRADLKK